MPRGIGYRRPRAPGGGNQYRRTRPPRDDRQRYTWNVQSTAKTGGICIGTFATYYDAREKVPEVLAALQRVNGIVIPAEELVMWKYEVGHPEHPLMQYRGKTTKKGLWFAPDSDFVRDYVEPYEGGEQ